MRSSAAQILETALALQRAPGERFRLRERPLPGGMVHVLEVAAGSTQAVQATAAELGEQESALVEAARFYLEQVLFADPDADAYRVLGLAPDVAHDTIRIHHRWLQRWLHPDRAVAGDASVFATRVNQAFAQLRSPEARHAYDVRLAEARLAGASAPLPPETVHRWEHADVEEPRYGRRSRWLLAAALVCCVVLAVLIVRNPEREAPWQPGDGFDVAGVDTGEHDAPAIEDRDLGILGDALSRQRETGQAVQPDDVAVDAAPAEAADTGLPVAPVPQRVAIAPASPATTPAPAPVRSPPRLAPARDFRNVASAVDTVRAPAKAVRAPAKAVPARPMADAGVATAASPPAARSAAAAATESAIAAAAPAQVPTPGAPAATSEAAPPAAPTADASPAPALDGALAMARMRLAEQRVAEVAAFLAARPDAVPMWNDPRVMAEATRLRGQLDARKGSRLDLGRPSWRLSAERARISAGYRCRSTSGAPCQGTLGIDLVWREGMWLVRDVDLGPPA